MKLHDYSGMECGDLKIISPVGRVKDGSTMRKLYLALNKVTKRKFYIRSNQILKKCRCHNIKYDDGRTFVIKRTNTITTQSDYLEDKYFSVRREAKIFSLSDAEATVDRLEQAWPGYDFKMVEANEH